jgi:hypothetical protein
MLNPFAYLSASKVARPAYRRGDTVTATINGCTVAASVLIGSTTDYGLNGVRTVGALVKFTLWSSARLRWVTVKTVVPFADLALISAAAA